MPWCRQKCPYCDFNSHRQPEQLPESQYLAALLQDLKQGLPLVAARPLQSVFFGGGTPSLFSAQAIGQVLEALAKQVGFAPDIEITLEANPGTAEKERFRDYRLAGVNRLSLGIQSFHNQRLQALGRIHNADEALQAVHKAHQAGFDNLNLDLMHGLPDQDLKEALSDLAMALSLQPTHLSWYQLTIEPNTAFWQQPPRLPEEDTLWDIQEQGQQLLAEQGYIQYEVSAYALPTHQARHNLNYWQFGDYLGLGAGAHAKLTRPDGNVLRHWKTRQPQDYLNPNTPFVAGQQQLTPADLAFEFLLNALRLQEGVPASLFKSRTGLPLERLEPMRQQAIAEGLLNPDPERLQTTPRGQLFLNDLLQRFLP